jgi:hypothetical protein
VADGENAPDVGETWRNQTSESRLKNWHATTYDILPVVVI